MNRRSLLAASCCLFALPGFAAETEIPVAARKDIEITVYESNLALIKDRRTVKLPAAAADLAFTGVSGQMQPETALFRALNGPGFDVAEQVFDFDVVSPQKLLEGSVGKEVTVVTTNPSNGKETAVRGKILAVREGLVMEIGGKIYTEAPGRIVYDALPPDVRATPTLVLKVAGKAGDESLTELSYLTGGLGWHADYVAEYDADAGRLDLNGWATVVNTAGVDFKNVALKVVSGQVNRTALPRPEMMMKQSRAADMAMAAPPGFSPQSLSGYYLYDLGPMNDLGANETKQLSLLSGRGIAVKREYVVRGELQYATNQFPGKPPITQAETSISFKNDSAAKMGLPLPAGVVRIYGQDASGAPQFLGEDRLEHTPEGRDVHLTLGRDFDIGAEREQVTFVRATENMTLSTWRITIKNAKAKPAAVRIIEPMSGDWEITKESAPHEKSNNAAAEWTVTVPAKGQAVVEYNVRTRF